MCSMPVTVAWRDEESPRYLRGAGPMGVLKRVKRPIECGPSGIGRVLSPLVRVPSGTSKTYRSLLLAVSRSTINTPSEYIYYNILFLRSPQALLGHFTIYSTAKEIRIKSGAPRCLVLTVVFGMRSILVIGNWTYQSFGKSGVR